MNKLNLTHLGIPSLGATNVNKPIRKLTVLSPNVKSPSGLTEKNRNNLNQFNSTNQGIPSLGATNVNKSILKPTANSALSANQKITSGLTEKPRSDLNKSVACNRLPSVVSSNFFQDYELKSKVNF